MIPPTRTHPYQGKTKVLVVAHPERDYVALVLQGIGTHPFYMGAALTQDQLRDVVLQLVLAFGQVWPDEENDQ